MPEQLPAWTPFAHARVPSTDVRDPVRIEAIAKEFGTTVEAVQNVLEDIVAKDDVWINSRYQVNIRRMKSLIDDGPVLIHLSIKRRDKQPIGVERYRDFMRIKDELVSPEHEGVEIYPARSREVDTVTQYHLWIVDDATFRFPFGFNSGRKVLGDQDAESGAKQNPFEAHHRKE